MGIVKDPATVEIPIVGRHGHHNGSEVRHGIHQVVVGVRRQGGKPVDGDLGSFHHTGVAVRSTSVPELGDVLELAGPGVAVVGGVPVLPLGDHPVLVDVVVGHLAGRSIATPASAAVVVIGCAGDECLGAEDEEISLRGQCDVGFQGGRRRKGPAGTAVSLVLDGGSDRIFWVPPPIDGFGQIGGPEPSSPVVREGRERPAF
mmetsp:Transcript_18369/g.41911  ORF Transcript_18369/g.41911 Transcript_18369/m.41911 type:complete len:202 (+) Transcript_18369:529-1134(+)